MLGIARLIKPLHLPLNMLQGIELLRLDKQLVEQTISVLHRAVAAGHPFWDKEKLYPEHQTKPDDLAQGSRPASRSPEFPSILPLEHLGNAQRLPSPYQNLNHGLGLPVRGDAHLAGLIKDVFARDGIELGRVRFQIARSD